MEHLSNRQIFNKINQCTIEDNDLLLLCDKYFESINTLNTFELSNIGRKLKKVNPGYFIEKMKSFNIDEIKSNEYLSNAYFYCYYEEKIKYYEYDEDTFQDFLNDAEFIVSNCSQLELEKSLLNPYLLTIYKVVKIFSRHSSRYNIILDWINLINIEETPNDPIKIEGSNGEATEMASYKEFFYQHKAKYLEKTFNYKECIEVCDQALQTCSKLHYKNEVWLTARKLYSQCMLDQNETSIQNYISLADKYHHWYMYHKIANIYFSLNNLSEALYFSCKALILNKIDEKAMVNLIYDIGIFLTNSSRKDDANIFYEYSIYIKTIYGWKINEELKFIQKELKITSPTKPSLKKLYKISLEIVCSHDNLITGKILKFNKEKKFGFILDDFGNKQHFNKAICNYSNLKINDLVLFQLTNSKKGKTCKYVYKKER